MPSARPWMKWGLPPPKSEASTGNLSLVDYEVYSGIEVHDWPFFVRLDGWGFHSLTRKMNLKKPFDKRLAKALANSAKSFFVPFNPALCYIFSDELNFLFLRPTSFLRIEKIDSVFAGFLSSNFTKLIRTPTPVSFDCRVIPVGRKNVLRYLVWRQAECWRNHNNAWAQWIMINKAGVSPGVANKMLKGLKSPGMFQLCKKYGLDLDKTPAWQQRGMLLYTENYQKHGYNPITKTSVVVERRRVKIDWAPVAFESIDDKFFAKFVMNTGSVAC